MIGRSIRVNGVPSTVIGVMSEGFGFPARSRLWQPLSQWSAEARQQRDARVLQGLGQAGEGGHDHAGGRGSGTYRRCAGDRASGIEPGREAESGAVSLCHARWPSPDSLSDHDDDGRIRAPHRVRERGEPAAGASGESHARSRRAARDWREPLRIVRQLLVESLLLSLVGGLIGSGLGKRAVSSSRQRRERLAVLGEVRAGRAGLRLSRRICLGTAVRFGLIPALDVSRTDMISGRKEGGGSSGSPAAGRGAGRAASSLRSSC